MGPSRHVKTVLTQAEPATDMHKTLIRKPELGSYYCLQNKAVTLLVQEQRTPSYGYFEDQLWSRSLLQMTATQTAIQHAVIARSVRQVKTDQIYKKHTVDDETLLALSYADKSIVCRRNELNRHESSREHRVTVMTTFFLLALLAFYQRDILATLCHMAAGYKMLQDWAAVDKENSPNRIALKNAFSQFRIAAAIFLISETFPIGERLVCFEPSGTISDDTIVLHEVEINTQIMMIIGSLFVEMNPARGFKVPAVTPNFRHNGAGAWAQMRLGRANNETR